MNKYVVFLCLYVIYRHTHIHMTLVMFEYAHLSTLHVDSSLESPSVNTVLRYLKFRSFFPPSPLKRVATFSSILPALLCRKKKNKKKNFVDTNASLTNCNLLSCLSQPFPKWKNKLRRVIFLDNGQSCFEIYRNCVQN